MVSIPVAREVEDRVPTNLRAAIIVVHSETVDPPTPDHVAKVLRGMARSDPSMSYAIYGASPRFALSSDRGSGKIAVYRDRESLRAAIYSFLARTVRRDLRDRVATYSSTNERASYGGFEARRWTDVHEDKTARTPDQIVDDIAVGMPSDPEATVDDRAGAMTAPSTCACRPRRRWFPILTLIGVAMGVALVVTAIMAAAKRKRKPLHLQSPFSAGTALDEAPLVGDLMDDLVVIP